MGDRFRAGIATPGSKAPLQRIGDFEVIKTLGTGSFGKVKLGRHILTGSKIAMKFISKKKIATAEMSDRVQREIQYLGMLQHPHIIKLYDVTQTPESIVMVIEYLKGELFDYIVKTGRMAEPQARRFFQQIIAAVEYCHSNDIVHRDLKPENLLLDEQLNVKIADFGLSNVMRDGDFLKTSCGSPNYAAPEVISGKLYAGPEIDIWSCGVILYVMLCGRLPFDDDHIPMLFKKINGGIFSLPPYLSPGARHLLSRMLVVDSNKRITIPEIRELPWFQESLPAYLAKPARRPHERDPIDGVNGGSNSSESSPRFGEEAISNEGKEWIEGLGWLEPEGLRELASKTGDKEEDLLHALKEGSNKKLNIAYQLCADAYRAKVAAQHAVAERASGTPSNISRRPSAMIREPDFGHARSGIGILPGTIPRQPQDNSLARAKQARNPLNAGRGLSGMTQTEPATVQRSGTASHKARPRARWHFGIRSRSPPLEVMLEIYKTLQSLGFEWKRKPEKEASMDDAEASALLTEEDLKKKRRRDEEERIKVGQALYFVEARCPLDDVMVYMDIQLYQVDENDNYLVDFRNVGYRPIVRQSPRPGSVTPSESGTESERGSYTVPIPQAEDLRARLRASTNGPTVSDGVQVIRSKPNAPQVIPRLSTGVNSPFLFLECACKLIIELAIGGSQ